MEIVELSKFWMIEFLRYLSSRFTSIWMAVLLLLLMAASWCVSFPQGSIAVLVDFAIVLPLLLQFRLWDDLCDIERDRRLHPERVLSRSHRLAAFWALLTLIAILGVILIIWQRPTRSVVALAVLNGVMFVWYSMPQRTKWQTANYHIVLLKYPTFVFILANRSGHFWGVLLASAMVGVYLTMCLYEVWHDDHLRSIRGPRIAAAIETVLLLSVLMFCLGSQFRSANSSRRSSNLPPDMNSHYEGNPQ